MPSHKLQVRQTGWCVIMKLKKRILSILVVLTLCSQIWIPVQGEDEATAEPGQLYARSAVLMDGDTGRVLYGKEENQAMPMASTTKIMTCILALEQGNQEEEAAVSTYAAGQPKVKLGAQTEDTFYVKDLLYSLMLESHNDSAVIIAEHIAGSVEAFAKRMNEKAKELKCKNTYFVTPNGLDGFDEGGVHSTTAADLALIMRYCINDSPQKEAFLEITRTESYTFSNVKGSRSFSCSNHNAFLGMMEGALTGKTGFTGDAGYCYVGALRQGNRTFIIALLACGWPNNKGYKWKDARTLFEYGLNNYEYQKIWKEETPDPIPIKRGASEEQPFQRKETVAVTVMEQTPQWEMLLRKDETVTVETYMKEMCRAPIKKGVHVGEITYIIHGQTLKKFPIVTAESVEERDLSWCLGLTLKKWATGNQHMTE